jgi:Mg-chelatase subunit ChlD
MSSTDGLFVIDTESGPVRLGLAAELAHAAGAQLLRLDELIISTSDEAGGAALASALRSLTGSHAQTRRVA